MDNITMVKEWDDGQLYKLNGTNKGVRIIWGYATSGTGMHLWNDAWQLQNLEQLTMMENLKKTCLLMAICTRKFSVDR